MQNFNDEHIRVIKKNRVYYDSLIKNGTVSNLNSVIVNEFEKVYNEAIDARPVNTWCRACIIELIELVYINYEKFLDGKRKKSVPVPSTQKVRNPGRNAGKNK